MLSECFLWFLISALVCLFVIIVMFIIYMKCNMNNEDNKETIPLMGVKVDTSKTPNIIDMSNIKKAISKGVSPIRNKENRVNFINPNPEIEFTNIDKIAKIYKKIGDGSFSDVYLYDLSDLSDNNKVIKIGRGERRFYKDCLAEINCLKFSKHGNIIKMIDSFLLNSIHICMVLPRYNCCLWIYYSSVIKYKKITLKDYSFIFKSLINGLEYLESVGIIHLDMKPENILINHKSDSKEIQKVVISDFSSFIKYIEEKIKYNKDHISLYYRTPEIILRSKHISKTHKWCLACIMYEVYTKKPLFYVKSNNKLLDHKNLTVENNRLLELQCSLRGLPSEEYLESNNLDKKLFNGIKLNETKRLQVEKELEKNPYGHILWKLLELEEHKRAKFSDFKALID